MKYSWPADSTDRTVLVFIQDASATDGSGLSGVAYDDLTARYIRVETDNDVTINTLTLSALSALTDAHSDGGWFEVDATNAPGWYRLDLPDAVLAAGAWAAGVSLIDAGSNDIAPVTIEIQLTSIDMETSLAAVLADTGTDGVVLSAAQMNKVADHVMRRKNANVRASSDGDAIDDMQSLFGQVSFRTNGFAISGSTLTVYEEDGSTPFDTMTVTVTPGLNPISGIVIA